MTGPGEPTEPMEPVRARPADEPPVDTPVPDPGGWLGVVRTHLGFALVLLTAAVGILRITEYHWRQGAALIGAALVLAALFRAILSPRRAGLLAVRGRPVDVLAYAGLGALMLFVALTIQGGPFG
jgi:thiol:disulfide interchange protein